VEKKHPFDSKFPSTLLEPILSLKKSISKTMYQCHLSPVLYQQESLVCRGKTWKVDYRISGEQNSQEAQVPKQDRVIKRRVCFPQHQTSAEDGKI
jgi:hypothetical protein